MYLALQVIDVILEAKVPEIDFNFLVERVLKIGQQQSGQNLLQLL
jgi:hypothetical protein